MTTAAHALMAVTSHRRPEPASAAPWWRGFGIRPATDAPPEGDFVAFAQAAAPRLRKTAFLMCRDWHLAHDLTQITLAKMFARWKQLSNTANLEAYSRKVLMRALFDIRRRRSDQEISVDAVPETHRGHAVTGHANESDLRVTLLDALAELPERDRAIVVLRYWEDNSVETVADVLGVSLSVVKTQSARSLARLRNRLGDSRAELLVD